MKKKLLLSLSFVMVTSLFFVNKLSAQSVTMVSIQSPVQAGTNDAIMLTYTAAETVKIDAKLYLTNTGDNGVDFSTYQGNLLSAVLPAGTDVAYNFNYALPSSLVASSALPSGRKYIYYFQLQKSVGGFLSDNGKPANIVTITAATLGLANNVKGQVQFYPNPVKDVLTIPAGSDINSVSIIDMSGRTVKSVNNEESVDVSNLKKGVYLIKTDKGQSKFVKQ